MLDDLLKKLNEIKPKYKVTLPISKKEIEYHPFKVKDQKIISLISKENNIGLILQNLCKLVESCSNIDDAKKLYVADLEYIFLKIRAKSVEEQIKLKIDRTPPLYFSVHIDDIIIHEGILKDDIVLDSGIALELEQPIVSDYFNCSSLDENQFIKSCIKSMTIDKFRYDLSSMNGEEIQKILDEVYLKDNKKILEFIKNGPKLLYVIKTSSEEIKVEGFLRFFI
jgi:hypothetical protein